MSVVLFYVAAYSRSPVANGFRCISRRFAGVPAQRVHPRHCRPLRRVAVVPSALPAISQSAGLTADLTAKFLEVMTDAIDTILADHLGRPFSFSPLHTMSDCDGTLSKAIIQAFWNGEGVACLLVLVCARAGPCVCECVCLCLCLCMCLCVCVPVRVCVCVSV